MKLFRILYLLSLCMLCASSRSNDASRLYGYVEGEFVCVVAPFAGTLTKLEVKPGQEIESGVPVFSLKKENEAAAKKTDRGGLRNSDAQPLESRHESGTDELHAIRSQLAKALSAQQLSRLQLDKNLKLDEKGWGSKAQEEANLANFLNDSARVLELQYQLKVSRLSAHAEQSRAGAANGDGSGKLPDQATLQPNQKRIASFKGGKVFDTLYSEGEWVPAGSPVLRILPPENTKIRFFVPQTLIGRLKTGQIVKAHCDGCEKSVELKIHYISRQAEYTPHIAQGKEGRATLVYLVEALPNSKEVARYLNPGQPVEVIM